MSDPLQPGDPSPRTLEALQQALANIKELRAQDKEANDKAINLLQANADKSPTTTDLSGEMKRIEQVTKEKFNGVDQKFADLISRIEQASIKDAKAVDAAFSAQKEAVGEQNKSNALAREKQDAGVTKQIDQITLLISTLAQSIGDKVNDVKLSVAAIQNHSKGIGDSWGVLLGVGGLAVAALMAVLAAATTAVAVFTLMKQ